MIPAVNMPNIKLVALWGLVIILLVMLWHFTLRTL